MSAQEMSHGIDVEQGGRRRRRRRKAAAESNDDEVSEWFSDAEDDAGSCYSQFYSTTGGSYDEYSFACVTDDPEIGSRGGGGSGRSGSRRASSVSSASSDRSVEINENDIAELEIKVHVGNKGETEKDCRICHLGLESNSHESGAPIQLGCSCKDDLAAAHRQCAEAWFKIRGNKICEICHSIARNVAGAAEIESAEQSNESSNAAATATAVVSASSTPHGETRSLWQAHRFLNFLLACMVFAFVISWLFHFNVQST